MRDIFLKSWFKIAGLKPSVDISVVPTELGCVQNPVGMNDILTTGFNPLIFPTEQQGIIVFVVGLFMF